VSRILTYLEIGDRVVPMVDAYFNFRRGRLTGTFSYDRGYVAQPGAYPIDPSLRLTMGSWALPQGLPGAFSDAAPDRWGRKLIARHLRGEAGTEGKPAPVLDDLSNRRPIDFQTVRMLPCSRSLSLSILYNPNLVP
jgi:serine/threonine-protein kinase HipA